MMHESRNSWIARTVAAGSVVIGSVVAFALLGGIRLAHSAIRLDQYVEPVPANTAKPSVTGKAVVGEELAASTGTWTGGVDSYSYQWQRCTGAMVCTNVRDGTAKTYGVRDADVRSRLRVVVRAHNAGGTAAGVASDPTAVVTAVTTPSRTNHAPRLTFLSLKRVGTLIYSRFRVCDDSTARVKITEHDSHPGVLGQTRYYAVSALPCKTYARHWGLAARFRHGAYTATLQARDHQGAMSPKRRMTLRFPAL
jgi:hypothetical protein